MGPSSDKALTFMKDHFLMDEHVVGTPLLVKSGVEYTRLAVEAAQGLDGSSHVVMYLGTCEYGLPEYTWHDQSRDTNPRLRQEAFESILVFSP